MSRLRSEAALEAALSSLPKGLHETYQRSLLKTLDVDKVYLQRAMLWLAWSLYPLTLENVVDALVLEQGMTTYDSRARLSDPEDLLEICGTFAMLGESSGRDHEVHQLRLAHHSVRDYFCEELSHTSEFWLPAKASHHKLAVSCLTYILLDDWTDLSKNRPEKEVSDEVDRHGLLRYAAESWPIHVLQSEAEVEILPLISKLMTPAPNSAFGFWMTIKKNYSSRWLASSPPPQPLYYAASYGLEQTVKSLISQGADLNARAGVFGGTALHAACYRRHPNIVRMLLDAKADTNIVDFNGMTAVDFGVVYKDATVADVLLRHLENLGTPNLKLQSVARGGV